MKQIVLGTAGHIDHGKTSLIKALTGIDTDRLKEEKLRGITIELGFASLDLPSGQRLGIVDVPGHEKFVKNMVAGATGIDIVAMVIAADEGVMPQTREHLDICSLLEVRHGLVVCTKTDMVDGEWLDLVTEEIQDFLQGTFLEGAPIVPVSAVTGEGMGTLKEVIDRVCKEVPARSTSGLFRLPVDRVFSMRGFGTVITGTLISGKVQVGDTIMVYPSAIKSKVRGLQVHNESVTEAQVGMRTAINFQGLDRAVIQRGNVVALPGTLTPSHMVDVRLHLLEGNSRPLKNRHKVRFHTGTSEILGNVILLDREELLPGESALVQIRLDEPVCIVRDDRFVIRTYSPVHTVGGGTVLNPVPAKHKRFKAPVLQDLERMADASPQELVALLAADSGYHGVGPPQLAVMTNLPAKKLHQHVEHLLSQRTLIQTERENKTYVHHRVMEELEQQARTWLEQYHRDHPLKGGMPKEELKSKFPSDLSPRLFALLLDRMAHSGELTLEEDIARLSGHTVALGEEQADLERKIRDAYRQSGLTPPYFKELAQSLRLDGDRGKDVLLHMIEGGVLVKVKEDLFFDAETLEDLKNRLVDHLKVHGTISTPEFKEMTGASRKYVIPLLEFFDSKRVTLRIGDNRTLRTG